MLKYPVEAIAHAISAFVSRAQRLFWWIHIESSHTVEERKVNLLGHLEEKKQIVADLTEKFQSAQSVVVIDYKGVNAKQTTKLRKTLRENGVDYVVAKNTLLRRAATECGYEALSDAFVGVSAVAFCNDDVVKPANLISKFIKEEKICVMKAGVIEGEVIDAAKVEVLGSLPGKEALLAQVAACFLAPLSNVCYALDAVRKKAEEEATA